MKTDTKLLNLAEELVAYGRKKGADQVEVTISEGKEFNVSVLEGKIETLVEAGSKALNVKIIKEERVATASSSDLSKDTLHHLIENAVKRAQVTNPDEFSALPEKEPVTVNFDSLKMYDPAIPALSPEKKIKRAKDVESICLADKRVKKSYGAGFSTGEASIYLANSNGFSDSYGRTGCNCGIYLQSGDGDNLFDEGKYDLSRNYRNLMSSEEIAKEAIHRVTRLIGARKIESQILPVVMEASTARFLLQFLNTCVTGTNIYLKQSFLAGKLGEQIANDKITVIDDGLLPGAPGTRPFDDEGVPLRKTTVVEKGVLKSYLMNTYAARKLNLKSTGNGYGANNLYLAPGTHTLEEIIASVDKGLLLTNTMGHGLIASTGDISKGAFGLMIEDGEITYPVAEITISGNLAEVLQNVEMVGNDLKHNQSIVSPTLKVTGFTIGGK